MNIQDIVRIEREAYPYAFRQMQDCESMSDIADYCEVKTKKLIVLGESGKWYALVARHKKSSAEFVDIAKVPGTARIPWEDIISELRKRGIKRISADLREKTSYKVILKFHKMLGVSILKDKEYYDSCFGETMHDMVFQL